MHKELQPSDPTEVVAGRDRVLELLRALHAQAVFERGSYAIVVFSIDRFRLLNARLGYEHADALLGRIAAHARNFMRGIGLFGRFGADEFICVLPDAGSDAAHRAAEQLRARLRALVIPLGGQVVTVTASLGVAGYPEHGTALQTVLMAAEEAMLEARRAGRDRVSAADATRASRLNIGSTLESALREERLMPAYQPIYDLHGEQQVAEEALARVILLDHSVLAAKDFIDAATELELTPRVDRVILSSALRRCADLAERGERLTVFANISGGLLRNAELVSDLFRRTPSAGRERLVLEITERELLDDARAARALLDPLLAYGVRLALDDFGSGYSSLNYLADLPVSFLKIDGRLVRRLYEPRVRAIVRSVQHTADALGLVTLAEFVEEEQQADILREIGVNWGQGHYFSIATMDEGEAASRRKMSVNWESGYYYRKAADGPPPGAGR